MHFLPYFAANKEYWPICAPISTQIEIYFKLMSLNKNLKPKYPKR
jgi:hypothetical protein